MKIVVTSMPACSQCTNTKNLLKFSLLSFESKEIQRDSPEFEQLVAEGVKTFPVVDVFRKDGSLYKRWTGYQAHEVSELSKNGIPNDQEPVYAGATGPATSEPMMAFA